MHYVAIVKRQDGEELEREVEIVEVAPYRYQLTIGGRTVEVDAHAITDDTLSLVMHDQAYNIESERDPSGKGENLLVRGQVVSLEVLDLRRMRLRRASGPAQTQDGPVTLTAPMPGKVVAVMVKDGDAVVAGQGLVVVEAMKMENELRAPKDGVVRSIKVQAGQAVEGGTPLCVVE